MPHNNPSPRGGSGSGAHVAAGLLVTGVALGVGAIALTGLAVASLATGEDVSSMIKRLKKGTRSSSEHNEREIESIRKRRRSLLSCKSHLERRRKAPPSQFLSVEPLGSANSKV